MNPNHSISDKWYYTCNNKSFINKMSAITEAGLIQPIKFNSPVEYESFNFVNEPSESWYELLSNKAQVLRESYDYLRIWYSGGCDSHTILEVFLNNNIHIDEIVCVKSGFSEADFEIINYAEPYLKKIKNLIPKTKISIETFSIDDYKKYYSNPAWLENSLLRKPNNFNFHFRINYMKESNIEYRNTERSINIKGKEKPKLIHINNEWYTYFLDVDIEHQYGQCNFFVDDPKLHSKQCHMLMNAIIKNINKKDFNHVSDYGKYEDFWNQHSGRYIFGTNKGPRKAMLFDNVSWGNTKLHIINQKDNIALRKATESCPDLVLKWNNKLNEYSEMFEGKWFNQGRFELGTVGVFSNFYGLTKKSTKTVDELFPNGFKV